VMQWKALTMASSSLFAALRVQGTANCTAICVGTVQLVVHVFSLWRRKACRFSEPFMFAKQKQNWPHTSGTMSRMSVGKQLIFGAERG
jgi:hypothetical protein